MKVIAAISCLLFSQFCMAYTGSCEDVDKTLTITNLEQGIFCADSAGINNESGSEIFGSPQMPAERLVHLTGHCVAKNQFTETREVTAYNIMKKTMFVQPATVHHMCIRLVNVN